MSVDTLPKGVLRCLLDEYDNVQNNWTQTHAYTISIMSIC